MWRSSVAIVLGGCGLVVTGVAPPDEGLADGGSRDQGLADSGPPDGSPADGAEDAAVDVDAVTPSADAATLVCGDRACPDGTDRCGDAGECLATTTIAVDVDGRSDLIIAGSSMHWHHIEYEVPGATYVDGAPWVPTWPQPTRDCDCDSSSTTVIPALPARDQNVHIVQTAGRFTVTAAQPKKGNGHALTLRFDDDKSGSDRYELTLTYETL